MALSITRKGLSFDEQFAAGFYGPDGWEKEPITSTLGVDGQTIGQIFPHADEGLCVTGHVDDKPVGHCNANEWSHFLDQLPINLYKLKNLEQEGPQKFFKLLSTVCAEEWVGLRPHLLALGLSMKDIAHRCGLMTILPGQGIATKLVIESDILLKEKGFKAVVVKTTHAGSRRVFEKNGYSAFKAFNLKDFGIDLDDQYTILYKIF